MINTVLYVSSVSLVHSSSSLDGVLLFKLYLYVLLYSFTALSKRDFQRKVLSVAGIVSTACVSWLCFSVMWGGKGMLLLGIVTALDSSSFVVFSPVVYRGVWLHRIQDAGHSLAYPNYRGRDPLHVLLVPSAA